MTDTPAVLAFTYSETFTRASHRRSVTHHAAGGVPITLHPTGEQVGTAPLTDTGSQLQAGLTFDDTPAGREAQALYADGALTALLRSEPRGTAERAVQRVLLHPPGFGPHDASAKQVALATRARPAPQPRRRTWNDVRNEIRPLIAEMDRNLEKLKQR